MSHQVKAPIGFTKANVTPGTKLALSATHIRCTYVEVSAKRAAADNTGNVFIGGTGLVAGTAEQVELAPGDVWWREARSGECFDLYDIYMDADTATDGVAGYYIPQ